MKKIIPFNNVLEFNTDVREITAISLEHEINKYPDMISGTFYISGEYKITDGQLDKEKFNFELPFDIALTNSYELDTLLVDIDDFRYDIISDKSLKVNIDLYIDGEEIEIPQERNSYTEELPTSKENRDLTDDILESPHEAEEYNHEEQEFDEEHSECLQSPEEEHQTEFKEPEEFDVEPERIDLLKEMLTTNKENNMNEKNNNENLNNNHDISINNDNNNVNTNILMPNEEENYVTYRVYKVLETDTLDSILTKYNVTKEILSDYNNIENITPGDKLIIPTSNEK